MKSSQPNTDRHPAISANEACTQPSELALRRRDDALNERVCKLVRVRTLPVGAQLSLRREEEREVMLEVGEERCRVAFGGPM